MGVIEKEFLTAESVERIIGLKEHIPLQLDEMSRNLKVTFYQFNPVSDALTNFIEKLRTGFEQVGIEVLEFQDTLNEKNKVKPNITVIAAGMTNDAKDMMVNHVSSLYINPVVGLYEGDSPVKEDASNQDKLNSIITVLAYDVVHLAIFVNEKEWTICTMNGAVIPVNHDDDISDTIENCLVPKLTAQVIPPNILTHIDYRYNRFDPLADTFSPIIDDIRKTSTLLNNDGLIMSHTRVDSLKYKNKFHERVIKAYLDDRSGMSYGFISWQLPLNSKPAVLENRGGQKNTTIPVSFLGEEYFVEIPDVWVLSTRSGSNKSDLDVSKDLVCLGLVNGEIKLDLPMGVGNDQDIKPSYDTLAILAHAVGNSIVSSLLKAVKGENQFSRALDSDGLSLFHWHGYLDKDQIPDYHFEHGRDNPSVSCSTRQSAVYSLIGKLEALENSIHANSDFYGDIHVEPHHGTNISSTSSLSSIVGLLLNIRK